MRKNTEDKTLERNYESKWKFLINEYLLTKQKKHPRYRFVSDFYKAHNISRQTFNKYYNRYLISDARESFLPRKRGPKWKSRRPEEFIETTILNLRLQGLNKYEICLVARDKLKEKTPSPSGVYNILLRHGLNKLRSKEKEHKRKIIKMIAGELGHIDCHYLSRDLLINDTKRYYLVGVVDDASRLAWVELVENIKSLTVMFATMKCFMNLKSRYNIEFTNILTDNGAEFASRNNIQEHPFERMLYEMGVTHRYTRPYRPQTNGKIERFWRTLNDDLIEGTSFDDVDEFKQELVDYINYYNEYRPHQGINGNIPAEYLKKCQRIS